MATRLCDHYGDKVQERRSYLHRYLTINNCSIDLNNDTGQKTDITVVEEERKDKNMVIIIVSVVAAVVVLLVLLARMLWDRMKHVHGNLRTNNKHLLQEHNQDWQ